VHLPKVEKYVVDMPWRFMSFRAGRWPGSRLTGAARTLRALLRSLI